MNQFNCPHCGQILQDDGSLAGQTVACPICGQMFLMPGGPPPSVAPETAVQPAQSLAPPDAGWAPPAEAPAGPPPEMPSGPPPEMSLGPPTEMPSGPPSLMPPETIAEPAAAPPAADDDAEMSLPFELAPASFTASRVAKTTSESRGSKIMLWLIIGGMGFVVALVAVIFAVGKFHELITPDSGGSDPATLLARLKSEDSGTRRDAADAILRSGPKTLIHALDDITVVDNDRLAISQNGLHALAALGSDLVSPLTSALHSDSATARAGAARVLREMGTNGKGAAAALGDCLDDKQRVVRLTAVDTLTDLGPDAAPAVDRLAASMTCSDPEVRRKAAKALGKIGSGAKSAVAALNMAARTAPPDYKTELEARAALKAIDPDGASAHVLEHASPEIQDLVHALISSESTADERVTAANTLGAKGHEGAVAIPILYKFVRDEKDKSLRLTAAEALGHFGAEAYYVAPGLDAIAASADGEVAAAVRAALESIRAKK